MRGGEGEGQDRDVDDVEGDGDDGVEDDRSDAGGGDGCNPAGAGSNEAGDQPGGRDEGGEKGGVGGNEFEGGHVVVAASRTPRLRGNQLRAHRYRACRRARSAWQHLQLERTSFARSSGPWSNDDTSTPFRRRRRRHRYN